MSASSSPAPITAAKLLTADELAERWQIPKSHVYRLSREGSLPTVQLGRYRRFRLDAVLRTSSALEDSRHDSHRARAHPPGRPPPR